MRGSCGGSCQGIWCQFPCQSHFGLLAVTQLAVPRGAADRSAFCRQRDGGGDGVPRRTYSRRNTTCRHTLERYSWTLCPWLVEAVFDQISGIDFAESRPGCCTRIDRVLLWHVRQGWAVIWKMATLSGGSQHAGNPAIMAMLSAWLYCCVNVKLGCLVQQAQTAQWKKFQSLLQLFRLSYNLKWLWKIVSVSLVQTFYLNMTPYCATQEQNGH